MITIDELKAKLGGMKTAVDDLRAALSIEASEKRLAELEHQMTMPGFYDDQARSQKVISENTSDQAELYQQLLDMKA